MSEKSSESFTKSSVTTDSTGASFTSSICESMSLMLIDPEGKFTETSLLVNARSPIETKVSVPPEGIFATISPPTIW